MLLTLIISGITCAAMIALILFKPKVKIFGLNIGTYWLIALIGAIILIAARAINFSEVWAGLTNNQSAVNPLKILALFISMAVLSVFLDETGFFRFLANAVVKRSSSGQLRLFTALYFAVSILTVFTSNDIIILTFTPFICYFTMNAKVNPIPYLVAQFVAANTASMMLIIGNPTNIYLASAAGINFAQYLKVMLLPTVFAVIAAYGIMLLLFYKTLKAPLTTETENVKIENKPLLVAGLTHLFVCTVLLVISSYINIEMWLITVCAALSLTLFSLSHAAAKKRAPKELANSFLHAPWELAPFVISMFVLVLALEKHGVTVKIAGALSYGSGIINYGVSSALAANVINNIPMSVLFSSVLNSPAASVADIYAVIIGSNIGAFLTPVGALAGIMWLSILKTRQVDFSFIKFIKYGAVIAVPALLAALGGLYISANFIS